jgi:hypothetical protein
MFHELSNHESLGSQRGTSQEITTFQAAAQNYAPTTWLQHSHPLVTT